VASLQAAMATGAPVLHDAAPGNLSLVHESGDAAAVQAAFARARHVTTLSMHSQRLTGAPLELRACLAQWDAEADVYTVYTPTQGMLGMRSSLSQVTGIPQDRIRVIADDVGGSFGLRGGTASEQVLLMLAARKLGKPVKWVASRSELFTGEWHGRGLTLKGSIALDADLRILAIRWDDQADLGAYTCYWQSFIGTRNISVTMGGVYRVPALFARQELIYTNTVPISAYRGAGRPDIAYAIERLIDQVAAEHGLDGAISLPKTSSPTPRPTARSTTVATLKAPSTRPWRWPISPATRHARPSHSARASCGDSGSAATSKPRARALRPRTW